MATAIDTYTAGTITENMSVEEKARIIRERAESLITNASLAQVEDRLPHYVPVVKELIAGLDYTKPLTLATVGSWALEDQANVGLEMLEAIQQGPSHQTLLEVNDFEMRLRERIKPLEERLAARSEKPSRISAAVSSFMSAATYLLKSKEQRKAAAVKALEAEIAGLEEDSKVLGDVVRKTQDDTIKMKKVIAGNKHLPAVIAEQIDRAMDTHGEAAEKLYLSLVAVNEYGATLRQDIVPDLEEKAASPNAIDGDIDHLQRSKEALALIETRRTDLMAAFLSTCLQRGMVSEMSKINANSAIEMERLESIALPQMLTMLGTLALQQRTGELVAGTKAANRILADTTKSTAEGFKRVLEMSAEADKAKLAAATAVVTATGTALKAVEAYRKHESKHIERQRAAQAQLAAAVGDLRVAAARVGKTDVLPKLDGQGTKALALQATGVLPVADADVVDALPAATTKASTAPAAEPAKPANRAADLFARARKDRAPN